MKSICFTGHRKLSETEELSKRLYQSLEKAVKNGTSDFYAGGAVGFDTLSSALVLKLREVYPHIKLHLILPCPNEEQTENWSKEEKSEFYRILGFADVVEYTSEHFYKGCMKVRNARLVELADCCFCYWNTVRQRSGTAQTVRMAQKKKIIIVNFFRSN